jgi:signal transduction histidine kinase
MAAHSIDLRRAWRHFFAYDDYGLTPQWLRFLMTLAFSAALAVPFTAVGFILYTSGDGAWRNWRGWLHWYGTNLVVSTTIGLVIYALFYLAHRIWGGERLQAQGFGRRRLVFSAVPLVGVAIGWPLGMALTGMDFVTWLGLNDANQLTRTVLLVLLIATIFNLIFSAKARQLEAERSATAAQLRLLQAQIEPHFLFNTLANVQSLMDHDLPKAKALLGSFTDYLRASLGTLRGDESTVAHELELAQSYLELLQIRMEDRLRFSIRADAAARRQPLPPLLLQPLVENAVVHGLEPSIEGGQVQVDARISGGQLVLEVRDDGRGLNAPPRAGARGSGLALTNIRQRLQTRYGSQATFELLPGQPGTLARITLPLDSPKP